jgi:hypothetical protein
VIPLAKPRIVRARLEPISAAEVFFVVLERLSTATDVRLSLVDRCVAFVLAGAVHQVSDGRWLAMLSAGELARFVGCSERHAQRARQNLTRADVFRQVATVRPAGTLVLELPREISRATTPSTLKGCVR